MAPNDYDNDFTWSDDPSENFGNFTETELLALQGVKYKTNTGGHRLGLYIALVFRSLEGHPNTYKDFFDPAVKSFKFTRILERSFLSIMIWRKDNVVIIAPDADWTVKWGAYYARSYRFMDSIWTIGFPTVNTFIGIGQDPKDPSNAKGVREDLKFTVEIERRAEAQLAKYLAKEEVRQEKEQAKEDKKKEKAAEKKRKADDKKQLMEEERKNKKNAAKKSAKAKAEVAA